MTLKIKGSSLDKHIEKQILSWEKSKKFFDEKIEKPRPFITISREYGCNASEITRLLIKRLNEFELTTDWKAYDKELIGQIVEDHQVSQFLIETIDTKKRKEVNEFIRGLITDNPSQVALYKKLVESIRSLSIHGRAVLIGRAGVILTKGLRFGTHIRLTAPLEYRIEKIMKLNKIKDHNNAKKTVTKKDKERHDFLNQYKKFNDEDPSAYDITINVSNFKTEEIVNIIIDLLKIRGFLS